MAITIPICKLQGLKEHSSHFLADIRPPTALAPSSGFSRRNCGARYWTPRNREAGWQCAPRVCALRRDSQLQAPASSPPADPGDTCEQGSQPGSVQSLPGDSPRTAAQVAGRAEGAVVGNHTITKKPWPLPVLKWICRISFFGSTLSNHNYNDEFPVKKNHGPYPMETQRSFHGIVIDPLGIDSYASVWGWGDSGWKQTTRQTNQTQVTEFFLLGLSDDPHTQQLLFILFLGVYLITVLGNLLLKSLVQVDSLLHTSMYFFCSLSLADLCSSTIIVPQALVHLLSRKKFISFTRCAAQILLFLILGVTQCAFLAVMSYDRYMAVCNPLHNPSIMTWRLCVQLAVGSWTSGILVSVVETTFTLRLYRGSNSIAHFFCEAPAPLILASTDTWTSEMVIFLMGIVILLIPVALILASYGCIVVTVVRMKSAAGQLKAFSTCGSHLMVVILFYGSAIVTYMIPKSSKELKKLLSVFHAMVTPMVNPLIYSPKKKDVKGVLRRVATRNFPCKIGVCH
ncbi:LOW QUALITY PROTEIN: olfactory receptor 2D2 [Molossus nigricans]